MPIFHLSVPQRAIEEGISRWAIISVFHFPVRLAPWCFASPLSQKALILPLLIPIIYLDLLPGLKVQSATSEGREEAPLVSSPLAFSHNPGCQTSLSLPVFLVFQISCFVSPLDAKRWGKCCSWEERSISPRPHCLLLCLMIDCLGRISRSRSKTACLSSKFHRRILLNIWSPRKSGQGTQSSP